MAKFHEPIAYLNEEELERAIQWGTIQREEAQKSEDQIWDEYDDRILHTLNSKLKQMRGSVA
ncbi:hypothetical protein [Acinetobacter sp. A47]|uniref:hypothetical protein n=1 Tax=Acinetobacter sp. A47 TaxID=1561217 RepID=UPI00056EA256|nr:hypothetical protein [Acinetobacter sp. A47]